jgi:WD40 repeat protein
MSADGRVAVSTSRDSTLRVWDLEGGQCLHTLEGHTYGSVVLTPDGRRAVSPGPGNSLRLWDLVSGRYLRTLERHSYEYCDAVLTPDGRRAVTGSRDALSVWDLDSGECVALCAIESPVHAIAVRPRGTEFAVGLLSGEVVLLTAVGLSHGPSILTAAHDGNARCPDCSAVFSVSLAVASAIESFCTDLTPDVSPCLSLPDFAFTDQRLFSRCPHCDAPLKFNPFFSDGPAASQPLIH